MKNNDIIIRTANAQDAADILQIYAPYVQNTAISFEYEIPTLAEFRERIVNTLRRYPYIVAEQDGEIIGYAYMGAFSARAAYNWAAEVTVYLKDGKRKMGLGGKLYTKLETIAKAQNIISLKACIAYPEIEDEYLTQNSVQFHAHLGYAIVGRFRKCGYKFARWYDVLWMEKLIGVHSENPLPLIPFAELDAHSLSALGL